MEPLRPRAVTPREEPTTFELHDLNREEQDIHSPFVDDGESDRVVLIGNNKKVSQHVHAYASAISTDSLDGQVTESAKHVLWKGLPHYLLTWDLLGIGLSLCFLSTAYLLGLRTR